MRLNQVTVGTTDVERAIAFYGGLGLRLIVRSPHYARFVCPASDETFSVHLDPDHRPGATVVYFECDDLDARCERLREAGYAFESGPADQRWLWREARLRDPDGNPICLFFAGDNRVDPPWRIPDEDT